MIVDWIFVVLVVAIPGVLAFAGVTLVLRRTPAGLAAGAALVVVAGLIPLLLAYAMALGIAAAGLGAVLAVVPRWRGLTAAGWALAAAAIVLVVAEPVAVVSAAQIKSDESYSRCAGDKAIAAIARSVAEGRGYPADMNEVAQFDGEYGDPDCYVSNSVNWLYRVAIPGTYTIGYWVDWHVARRVCLHTARTQGWTCGFESWGPFKPGEVD